MQVTCAPWPGSKCETCWPSGPGTHHEPTLRNYHTQRRWRSNANEIYCVKSCVNRTKQRHPVTRSCDLLRFTGMEYLTLTLNHLANKPQRTASTLFGLMYLILGNTMKQRASSAFYSNHPSRFDFFWRGFYFIWRGRLQYETLDYIRE